MPKNKIILGFDMDGVLIDHTLPKIRLAKERGFDLSPEQTPSDVLHRYLPEKIRRELQVTLYDHPVISITSPLMRGVVHILAEIKIKKWPFFLISRRKNPSNAITLLKKRKLWPKYFNEKNSFFVLEPKDKETKAAELGLTHYIDDEKKILDELKSVKNKFLFDYLRVAKNSPYRKISSWAEFGKSLGLTEENRQK